MNFRKLGKTGFEISEVSLGAWQVGGKWGDPFSHHTADRILNAAVDRGVNFIDTADVYSDGESEKAVGRLVRSRRERIYVATKCGRRLNPHDNNQYTTTNLRRFVEDSLANLGLDTIDLIQLHCPPTAVYYRPEIFELFDRLKQEGKISSLGVSVEKVEEALKAIGYANVDSVQIIFNVFRQRPTELFFGEAARKEVGIIARVPLASGLLSGHYHKNTEFKTGDHRFFNREGAAFDKGETFSGVNFDTGLKAVQALKEHFPATPLAQIALRWILMFKEVSCVIPGASRPEQLEMNLQAAELPPLSGEAMNFIAGIYEQYIKNPVHYLW